MHGIAWLSCIIIRILCIILYYNYVFIHICYIIIIRASYNNIHYNINMHITNLYPGVVNDGQFKLYCKLNMRIA